VDSLERASFCQYLSGLVMETLAQWLSDRDISFHHTHPLHLSHFKREKDKALETLFVINLRR